MQKPFFRTADWNVPLPHYLEHQWGQTYTFDKMWIIDRMASLGKIWLEYSEEIY